MGAAPLKTTRVWVLTLTRNPLKRYHGRGDLHFITFCCCRRDRFSMCDYSSARMSTEPNASKKSTSQCAENGRDTLGRVFIFFSLAPRNPRAYKKTVSSWSSGGLHESTGLRSARQLSTPLLRCESRTNRLKANPLVKRRSKRKKRALIEGPLLIWSRQILVYSPACGESRLVFTTPNCSERALSSCGLM